MVKSPLDNSWSKSHPLPRWKPNLFSIGTESTPKVFLEIVYRQKTLVKLPDIDEELGLISQTWQMWAMVI